MHRCNPCRWQRDRSWDSRGIWSLEEDKAKGHSLVPVPWAFCLILISYHLFLVLRNFSYSMCLFAFQLQGVLHWVGEPSPGVEPLKVEVRLFDKLFLSEVGHYSFFELPFYKLLNVSDSFIIASRILLSLMTGLVIWIPSLKWWCLVHMLYLHFVMLQLETAFSLKG